MLPRILPTKESDPILHPYRAGLVFGFFNAFTWQVAINTPMVLFLQWLGGSPAQVGLAFSFIYVLTPVQIFATVLLPRHGFRRVMLAGWGLRAVFVAVPVILAVLAPLYPGPWAAHTLVASVFFFCLLRAIGQSAFAPWIYSLLPGDSCGRYFAADQYVSGIGGALTLIAVTLLFRWLPVQHGLVAAYLIALFGAVACYFALRRMPDGARPAKTSMRIILRDTPRHVTRTSLFRDYLWLSILFAVVATPLPPFSAYYLKVEAHLPESRIMMLEIFRYLGVIFAAGVMQARVERVGSKPFLVGSALAHAGVAIYWWFALRGAWVETVGLALAYFTVGAATAGLLAGNLNFLAKVTQPEDRTLMVSVHAAIVSLFGGGSTALWGVLLKVGDAEEPAISILGFQWFFLIVFVAAMVLAWRIGRLPEKIENRKAAVGF